MSDRQMQDLLEASYPNHLPTYQAAPAIAAAWTALSVDVTAGGWRQPHRTAGIALGSDPAGGEVWAVITWSGTSPQGELIDRNVSSVHLTRSGQSWHTTAIVSGPPSR